jgi:hypothetical protein
MNESQRAQWPLPLSVPEQPSDAQPEAERKEKHCQELSAQRGLFSILGLLPGHDEVGAVQLLIVPVRCLIDTWQIRHIQVRGHFRSSRWQGQEEDAKVNQEGNHKRPKASDVAKTVFAF